MNYLLLLIMTVLGAVAGFCLKRASGSNRIMDIPKSLFFYIGAGLYLCAAVINILLLRTMPYSVVLPLTAVTYVWTMVLSRYYLKENITNKKIIGIFAILLGAILVAA